MPNFAMISNNHHSVEYMRSSSPISSMGAYFDWLNTEYPFLHSHIHWEILLVLEGSIIHEINGVKYLMQSGNACLIRPKDTHKIKFKEKNSNCQYINFLMSDEYVKNTLSEFHPSYYERFESTSSLSDFKINNYEVNDLISKCLKIQNTEKNLLIESQIQFKIILLFLFSKLIESKLLDYNVMPEWLNNLLFMLNSKTSFTMSIDEIAKNTPFSYSHLSYLFKKHMNTTLICYRNKIKIDYAKNLLTSSTETMLNISTTLGFDSLSHFNHIFKKSEGLTPSEYRKNNISNQLQKL